MITAEVRRFIPGAGGLLSDSNDHAGFSFQISETPPPARASERTPLADLVLDMCDFGPAADPSPLPPSQAPTQQPISVAPSLRSAWVDEPIQAQAPKLEAPKLEAPKLEAPKPAEPVRPEAALKPAAPVPLAPQIKKISFPAAKGKSPAGEKTQDAQAQDTKTHKPKVHDLKAERDSRAPSKTKFSKSISPEAPRPALDSEPEVDLQGPASPESVEMAPPEDLPGTDQEFLPNEDAASWNSDTPSAREIWKRARTSWHAASRQAAALSGQGLRASKALAETVNEKVRERLREASAPRPAEPEAIPKAAPFASASVNTAPVSRAPLIHDAAGGSARRAQSPSMAGRVILGLARSAGRKVAAPASALAAAALVYFVGSHFLGADASVSLSKAGKAPDVPELGSLDSSDKADSSEKSTEDAPPSGEKSPKNEKASSHGPPPMETEVTEMPKGMSWPGKGLIEVVTSQDELVYVDGVFTGRGPLRRIPVSPGEHEVSIRADGNERKGSVEVQAGKSTRAVFKGP